MKKKLFLSALILTLASFSFFASPTPTTTVTFCTEGYYGMCVYRSYLTFDCDFSDFVETRDCSGTYSVEW